VKILSSSSIFGILATYKKKQNYLEFEAFVAGLFVLFENHIQTVSKKNLVKYSLGFFLTSLELFLNMYCLVS